LRSLVTRLTAVSFLLLAAGSFAADAPAAQPPRPTIPILDAFTLKCSCDKVFENAQVQIAELEKVPVEGVTPAFLDKWDDLSIDIENVIGPVSILNNVHPDKAVRDAGDDCLVKLSNFATDLYQNEKLYQRVVALKPQTPAQTQFRKNLIESFEDSGVTLPGDKRKRFKEISERMTVLGQEFQKNIVENKTKLTFTPDEYKGLPQSYIDRLKDASGNIVVGFDYPDYGPFMSNSQNEAARKSYSIANSNRGTARNLQILDEMAGLRKELAGLYGLPSFAAYVTKRRMASSPEAVNKFLADVKNVVTTVEKSDIEELRKLKSQMTSTPLAQTKLNRWDISFYRDRLREQRFNIDQEALRKYFPAHETVRWLLDTSETLYGIRFKKAFVPAWHEDVEYYDVTDATDGKFLGGVYMDLYPRDGKFKHAACWPVRGVSTRIGRTPISVLVANLDRKGMTQDETETLFHEFGHALHGVLSATTYDQHAGTSVQLDFVEAPSQMFEEWTRRIASLQTIKKDCPDCPVMDQPLVDRLDAARRFGAGIDYAGQYQLAAFDMAMAGDHPSKAMDAWIKIMSDDILGYTPGTEFPGTFAHIAGGGYASGYYGYMWSQVLALDMLSAYGSNIMNPAVGQKFRTQILSRGGEEDAKALVERFLGRPANSQAFFEEITGKRQ
jgi:thimet oligopeptidase